MSVCYRNVAQKLGTHQLNTNILIPGVQSTAVSCATTSGRAADPWCEPSHPLGLLCLSRIPLKPGRVESAGKRANGWLRIKLFLVNDFPYRYEYITLCSKQGCRKTWLDAKNTEHCQEDPLRKGLGGFVHVCLLLMWYQETVSGLLFRAP